MGDIINFPNASAPSSRKISPSRAPKPDGSALSWSDEGAVLSYPLAHNTMLVADLAGAFMDLRDRYGRRSRQLLIDRRFRPIRLRLRRLGVSADRIARDLADLEAAVARVVWRRDGRPALSSGGGAAA